MNINFEKIEKETGCKFETEKDLRIYLSSLIDYLSSHNKNYTKEQHHKMQTIKDIFDCMED